MASSGPGIPPDSPRGWLGIETNNSLSSSCEDRLSAVNFFSVSISSWWSMLWCPWHCGRSYCLKLLNATLQNALSRGTSTRGGRLATGTWKHDDPEKFWQSSGAVWTRRWAWAITPCPILSSFLISHTVSVNAKHHQKWREKKKWKKSWDRFCD